MSKFSFFRQNSLQRRIFFLQARKCYSLLCQNTVGPNKKWHLRPPSKRKGGPLPLLHARSSSRIRLLDRGGILRSSALLAEGFAPGTPARWTLPPGAVSAQKAREIQKISASRPLRFRRPRRLRRGPRVYRGRTNDLMNTFCQFSVHHYYVTTYSYVQTT